MMRDSCQCAKIGVRSQYSFLESGGKFPRRLYSFEPAQTVQQDAACSFCRLLAASINSSDQLSQSIGSLSIHQNKFRLLTGSKQFPDPGVRYIKADVAEALSIMPLGDDADTMDTVRGNDTRKYARSLQGNIANRTHMRSWLHRCMDSHATCQAIERRVRRRMRGPKRLLNTKTMCVEMADWDSRYIALSYVWGGVPQPAVHGFGGITSEPNSFSVQNVMLPRTIVDAIRLTNELGETYLWVDLLCIDQDDPLEKAAEIAQMNEVYLAATATIVALCSKDANSGLPGVDEYHPPRTQQIESFEGIRLATVQPSPGDIMSGKNCIWNSRLWTMQEHLLSRRLLFLGPKQAYFSCSRSSYSEDRYESDHQKYEVHHHPGAVLLDTRRKFGNVPWYVWKTYTELYSTRNGSVDADRFLAFQGILNEQQRNGKISFAGGLDINHLPLALYWWHGSSRDSQLLVQPRRMGTLPSWSWVGWSGRVYFPDIYHYRPIVKQFLLRSKAGDRPLLYDEKGNLLAGDTEQYSNHTKSSPPPTGETHEQAADTQDAPGLQEEQRPPALIFEGVCVMVDSRCAPSKNLRGYIQVIAHQTLPAPESNLQPRLINSPTSTSAASQDPNPNCICVMLGRSPIWSPRIYLRPSFSFQSVEVPVQDLRTQLGTRISFIKL